MCLILFLFAAHPDDYDTTHYNIICRIVYLACQVLADFPPNLILTSKLKYICWHHKCEEVVPPFELWNVLHWFVCTICIFCFIVPILCEWIIKCCTNLVSKYVNVVFGTKTIYVWWLLYAFLKWHGLDRDIINTNYLEWMSPSWLLLCRVKGTQWNAHVWSEGAPVDCFCVE